MKRIYNGEIICDDKGYYRPFYTHDYDEFCLRRASGGFCMTISGNEIWDGHGSTKYMKVLENFIQDTEGT